MEYSEARGVQLIVALRAYGLAGDRSAGYSGVWVEEKESAGIEGAKLNGGSRRKIASIGVHARDWVTWHGFALNTTTDLSYFDLMIPCGIPGMVMTSIEREIARLERGPTLAQVGDEVARAFAQLFFLERVDIGMEALVERMDR